MFEGITNSSETYVDSTLNMSSKSFKKKSEDLKKEDVFQAVIIANNFNEAFDPITLSQPSCLIEVANIPLLDYSLEFLGLSGVQEAIVFCSFHADKIKNHIRQSKWSHPSSTMTINVLVSERCRSLGDAMRDIDAKAIIKNDFILLFGDTVANIEMLPILEKHRAYQKQDKGSVMTLLFKETGPGHKARSPQDKVLFAIDSMTNKVLYHKKLGATKKIHMPTEIFIEHSEVNIMYNFMDTQVSVCSPAVPPLFSDNFDFQTLEDLVKGLIINEEILCSSIYFHKLQGAEFAARVNNWHMYHSVSHDIMHRWTYPMVPDAPFIAENEAYTFLRHNVYKQKSVNLGMGCVLEEDVIIASGTTVGENSYITSSVVGKNCKIGKNVQITNSYVWDNTVIEDNCTVSFSLLAENCHIKSRSSLTEGCVVCSSVILEEGTVLKGKNIVSRPITKKDDFGYDADITCEKISEVAYIYTAKMEVSEDEVQIPKPPGLYSVEEESDEGEGVEEEESDSDMSYRDSPIPDDTNLFFSEVVDSLLRGFEDKLACDNLILEINSSRYAYNVSMQEVNYHVVRAILSLPSETKPAGFFVELHKYLVFFQPIFKNYVRNDEAQKECLKALEDMSNSRGELAEVLMKVLKFLYDSDILSEDTILQWHGSGDEASPTAASIRKQVLPFITWLQEADEESESDSD